MQQIRNNDIPAELYPAAVKMDKQMKYANAKKIPFVAFVGEEELKNNTITLKNMSSGEQQVLKFQDVALKLKEF